MTYRIIYAKQDEVEECGHSGRSAALPKIPTN
jgi:hypothetical protein